MGLVVYAIVKREAGRWYHAEAACNELCCLCLLTVMLCLLFSVLPSH